MFKFGFKFLQDKKSKEGENTLGGKPELPVFEWQTSSDGGQSLRDSITEATATLTPPDDALLGAVEKRRPSPLRNTTRIKRSSTLTEPGRIRLIHILECKETRIKFRNYLVSQYCEENLDFYMDVSRYRSMFENSTMGIDDLEKEIISLANYIWDVYLDDDLCSKPLNVSQDLSNTCRRKIEAKKYPIDLFDKLQQHCFDLMVQDSLPKFTRNSLIVTNDQCPIQIIPATPTDKKTPLPATPTDKKTPLPRRSSFMGISPSLPRKSISSGSLRSTFTTIPSLNTSEPNLRTGNTSPTTTNNTSTSSSSSPSSPSSPMNQRTSVSASITNIKRRMLARRRDSTCSISSQMSVESNSSTSSPNKRLSVMPGSYPMSNDHETEYPSNNDYDISNAQKLRRNISTPNMHSSMDKVLSYSPRMPTFSSVLFGPILFNKTLTPAPERVS